MKTKKALIIVALIGMVLSVSLACSQPVEAPQEEERVTAPTLQPADHKGRFESAGMTFCYSCHGVNEAGEINDASAVLVSESHYVDESYGSLAFDTSRSQCTTCHPVIDE